MQATLYNQQGEKKGEVTLNDVVFGIKPNKSLMHQAVLFQMANSRKPIAHTKVQSDVRGGGRKPYRQKGTGNARQGSIRAPHYKGGGVVFGPRSNRNFTIKMPVGERRKALFSALSVKAHDKSVLVLDQYKGEAKTKPFANMIKALPITRSVLIVIPAKNEPFEKSARNLPQVKTILASYLNVKDVLQYRSILFLEEALPVIEKTFLKKA